ncbi:hypothetical protein [Paenibacillus sp. NPDC058071]|uniref:hypothetical protein n=1 Tax=Paenibacillus sp. NPDC058071 TaxID=3346326 RepID=UPI0036DA2D4C
MAILKSNKLNIIALLVSLLVSVYLFYVVVPYAENHGFLSENEIPEGNEAFGYFFICYPIIISYTVLILIFIRKLTFLLCLNYPIVFVNLYTGLFLCLIILGGAILWLAVLSFAFAVLALIILFLYGLFKDYRYIKKINRNQKEL